MNSDGLLLSYYGDDFTGSTDVMEALSSHGVPTVLFTRTPGEAEQAAFAGYRAVGLAGTSRSQSPEWMDANLPAAFSWLKRLGARHAHYKVCSTFDSAPHVGSIGRALEIGLTVFGQPMAPIVVGAPQLRRYTFAGHLFAAYRNEVFRIDRHPVMSRHPVTPMAEADLRLHLSQQTGHAVGLLDADALRAGSDAAVLERLAGDGFRACLIDVHDEASQARAGVLLRSAAAGPFVVGSSGVEYALVGAWRDAGLIDPEPAAAAPLAREERIVVVSGSCSPTTARQIETAKRCGFEPVAVDYMALATGQGYAAAFEGAASRGARALEAGRSPILHTALGESAGRAPEGASNDAVGRALGRLCGDLAERFGLSRLVVAGGDTSSHALSELDIVALTLRHPLPDSPGSPLCTGHRPGKRPSVEIALKGGQIGGDDYFVRLRDGASHRSGAV